MNLEDIANKIANISINSFTNLKERYIQDNSATEFNIYRQNVREGLIAGIHKLVKSHYDEFAHNNSTLSEEELSQILKEANLKAESFVNEFIDSGKMFTRPENGLITDQNEAYHNGYNDAKVAVRKVERENSNELRSIVMNKVMSLLEEKRPLIHPMVWEYFEYGANTAVFRYLETKQVPVKEIRTARYLKNKITTANKSTNT